MNSIAIILKNKIAIVGLALVAVAVVGAVTMVPESAFAQLQDGISKIKPNTSNNNEGSTDLTGTIKNIINAMLFIIGIIAVVMLVIGGIRYTASGGNEKSVEAAKNTILYAIIGIVIAFLAYAIINFVITRLTTGNN